MNLATRNDGIRDGARCLDGLHGGAICPVTFGAFGPIARGDSEWGFEFEPEILAGTIWDGGTVLHRHPAIGIEQEASPS